MELELKLELRLTMACRKGCTSFTPRWATQCGQNHSPREYTTNGGSRHNWWKQLSHRSQTIILLSEDVWLRRQERRWQHSTDDKGDSTHNTISRKSLSNTSVSFCAHWYAREVSGLYANAFSTIIVTSLYTAIRESQYRLCNTARRISSKHKGCGITAQ